MQDLNDSPITINGRMFASRHDFARTGRGCATAHPNHYEIARNDERMRTARARMRAVERIVIDVQFIHITDGNEGRITEQQRLDQVDVLNRALAPAGVLFTYNPAQVKAVDNAAWFGMDYNSAEEHQAKNALHASPERHLNFYTAGITGGLLGWATFPWDLTGDRDRDGVVILHESLPGGTAAPYNLGNTAVHEVCHWLGLFHTFQGGCDAFGDHVGDTPAHKSPDTGRPADGTLTKCNGGDSPIHNYMNYVDDDWMTELTAGQIQRIREYVAEYRPGFVA